MEIPYEEYIQLKNRVSELEEQLKCSTGNRILNFSSLVDVMPISSIRLIDDHDSSQGVKYSDFINGNGAWDCFVKLAKLIHLKDPSYIAERRNWNKDLYYRSYDYKNQPKRICDLTPEQVRVSINMMNELIAVYNRYFTELHKGVLVTELNGCTHFVEVED